MTGKVVELENIISPDLLATRLTEKYTDWVNARRLKENDWEEIRRYVYATDTSSTTNSALPWKNRTTIPKLCQIRDNLLSNYMQNCFPTRQWMEWIAATDDSNGKAKANAILNYMAWAIEQPSFKSEMFKIVLDYIDFGNCFATVEWVDQRVEQPDKTQVGYVGPAIRRISPLDIVMNPTSETFIESPKFIRSVISLGELRKMIERMSSDENKSAYESLWNYLKDLRFQAREFQGDWSQRDRLYQVDGFGSFREYLMSDYCEILTFYGDWYDPYENTLEKNRVIMVVDRHKLISNQPNPSYFGYPPIFHSPWRKKQDNLWGMGPLDNLIGMQYRLDHTENMRADIADLVRFPVQKVKGFVQDYTWQPGEKIFTEADSDVELAQPQVEIMSMLADMNNYMQLMEEMAGAPKEAMGFRTPGEKTKYEVQSLENAASRIFTSKTNQFEEQIIEPLLNAMLELARRNMTGPSVIRVFNDELKMATFQTLTADDITGIGRIKPIAARHSAEQAQLIQNLTGLTNSPLWAAVQPHFSTIKLAEIVEDVFDLADYKVVIPNIALAEQADAQRMVQTLQQQLQQEMVTPTGQGEDFDMEELNRPQPQEQPVV